VSQRVEKRADAEGNVGSELDQVRRRHFHELGERPVLVKTVDLCARADMPLPGAALRTLAANDVHLRGDVIAGGDVLAMSAFAELFHEAAKLVAVNPRRAHGIADRRVPVIDVLVRSANRGGGDADQDLIRTGFRYGTLSNFGSGCTVNRSGLDDGLHGEAA